MQEATPPRTPANVMNLRDTRINTPAEMLVRLVFASRYISFFSGLFLSAYALHHGSAHDALKALVCFAAMIAAHVWLKNHNKLDECHRALEGMFNGWAGQGDDDLDALLQRREALEEKRGTPGFDPWAVQAVRREINDYMKTHPESTRDLEGGR